MKRTALKRGSYIMKRHSANPLRRTALKKKSIEAIAKDIVNNEKTKEQMFFFEDIWNKLPSYKRLCYETNAWLGKEPLSTMFHHVLPKELYPQFRLSRWNIILVLPSVHNEYENYPENCPKIYALYLSFLEKLPTLVP